MTPQIDPVEFQRLTSVVRREAVGDACVYVKKYLMGGWDRTPEVITARTTREVELMQRLSMRGCPGRRLGQVRVVDATPESGIIVTAAVPGQDLSEILINNGLAECRRISFLTGKVLYLAGRWLRWFQGTEVKSTDKTISSHDPECLVDYCDFRMKVLCNLNYPWPTALTRRRVLARLECLMSAARGDELSRVWCHADYAPFNILWDGQFLTPIDFGMAHIGLPLRDLTYFVHRLEMERLYRPWRRLPLRAWRRVLMRGYGLDNADQLPTYSALMIRHLLCRLLTYVRRPPHNLKQRLHNNWVRRAVIFRLERYL